MSNINYNDYSCLISYLKSLSDNKYLEFNQKIVNTPVAGGKDGLRDMSTFWVVKE